MKGLAKPLVICNEMPSNIENMKNMAICFCRNNANALRPNTSDNDLIFLFRSIGQLGIVSAYAARIKLSIPDVNN